MRTFKEQIANDLARAFINGAEFADWHNLNGQQILCIVDSNTINPAAYSRSSSFNDGLTECDVVVLYKYVDYPKALDTTYECYLDKVKYEVHNFKYSDGLVELHLNRV